jgi:anti-sigma B factor antagonist
MTTLRLSARLIEGVSVVDCNGRIVFGDEAAALREFVKDQLKENKQIVINLANVNYIDSGGLGTLVGLYTSARGVGGTIKLANLTHRVGELLQVTKLLTVFEVFDGEDKAARSFTKGAVA